MSEIGYSGVTFFFAFAIATATALLFGLGPAIQLPGQAPSALSRVVDADYFATVQIPLIAGRTFDDRDRHGAQPVVAISREMADEFWRGEDPIGKTLDLDNVVLTIVGVVAGVRSSNFLAQPQPEMYVPHAQAPMRSLTFLLTTTQPSAHVLNAARQAHTGVTCITSPSRHRLEVGIATAHPRAHTRTPRAHRESFALLS